MLFPSLDNQMRRMIVHVSSRFNVSQTTMNYKEPTYHLTRPESTDFIPLRPSKRPSSPTSSQTLFQKSKLKAKAKMYSSRRVKELPDDSDDEPSTSSIQATSSSNKSEVTFVMPPEFDFSDLRARRKSASSAVFESPDDIKDSPTSLPSSSSPLSLKCFEPPPEFEFPTLSKSSTIRRCDFCQKVLPPSFVEDPPTAHRARFAYCRRHENVSSCDT